MKAVVNCNVCVCVFFFFLLFLHGPNLFPWRLRSVSENEALMFH